MERLTWKDELGYYAPKNVTLNCLKQRGELVDRLAAYEDLEEQGRLVVLPCKVGDMVYHPLLGEGKVETIYIRSMVLILAVFDDESHLFPIDEFGKSVFTSRAEAEAAPKGVSEDA